MAEVRRSPAAAFFLSIIPGAGHLYAGNIGGGIVWLFIMVLMWQMSPEVAWIVHFFCGLSALKSATAANRREGSDLQSRTESAEEFGQILDDAVHQSKPPLEESAAPVPKGDPPPRLVRGAYSAPPHVLLDALRDAMEQQGLRVAGVDADRLRVAARADLENGKVAPVIAQVEETPSGSRVRMILDRPAGARRDPRADDQRLRRILEHAEEALTSMSHMPGYRAPARAEEPSSTEPEDAGMSELQFLEDLREAWEAYDQGWMPEDEWVDRKSELIRELILRPDTRLGDFMTACRPLAEANILTPEDLKALEGALR